MAAACLPFKAKQSRVPGKRRIERLLQPKQRFGRFELLREDSPHLGDPSFARRVAPGLGSPKRTQVQIADAFFPKRPGERGFGKSGAA